MKRNNKGFTLIELLGAIVILGILIGVTVPLITSLLDTSRNKMYINDAKKLVTQAEYKLKSNSSSIEKPDEGDCIAVSMVYLDSSDFDNPPNEGKYEKENSFVIIKNNGGKLEYSVTIVEKVKKGGYKGVELVRDSALSGNNALSHVVSFKKSDLIHVETDVNKSYINEKLGNGYISDENSITAIYNYPDLDDSSSNNDVTGTPRITMASLISTSSKGYNSLDATLQLKVEDKDTPRSNLQVYLAVDSGYESATTPIAYGDNDTFSYNINLANYGKGYDGSSVKLYIIVKDPDGNKTKKTITYKIHKNEAPEIDSSTKITKRNGDKDKMTTGLVKLIVSDDVDDNNTLSVCLKESATNEDFTSCDNYQVYNSLFNSDNAMEYKFTTCDGGTCTRDGSKHYLTVFVKDSLGGISSKKLSYTFSENTAPIIASLSINSQKEEFTDDKSKTIVVNVVAEDDIDDADDMSVKISDGVGSKTYNYSSQPIYYDINSNYDGSTKTIQVTVIDSEGANTAQTKNYTLYKNQKPNINSFSVVSAETVCPNSALCPPEKGGSVNTNILLNAEDDIDYQNNYADLRVCISLNNDANSCSNYVSYSQFYNKTYSYVIPSEYDGNTKTIYAFVKDTYGLVDSKSFDYKVYKNQKPKINLVSFTSKSGLKPVNGNLNTIFRIEAEDDFDNANSLRLQIIEDDVVKVNNAILSDYIDKDNDYVISGSYNGVSRNIKVNVIDTNSNVSTVEKTYEVYNNSAPEIEVFDVYNNEIPCNDEMYCPLEDGGNYNAYYKIKLDDDLDNDEDIQVCISNTNSCSNYSSYSNYYDENGNPKEFSYTFDVDDSNKPYNGAERHLYLFAKDTSGSISKSEYVYTLYNDKAPTVISGPYLETKSGDLDINIPEATFSVGAEDDLDSTFEIKYCHKKDGAAEVCTNYENYNSSKDLDRSFFNSTHPNGEVYKVYAKLRDSYGKESTTEEIEYKLFTDISPVIYSTNIVSGEHIYIGSDGNEYTEVPDGVDVVSEKMKLKVFFTVDDPYDTFSVCLSENGTCTNYQNTYKANNCLHSSSDICQVNKYYTYYEKEGNIEVGDTFTLNIFVKDSYGNVSNKSVYNSSYTQCLDKDEEDAIYEYEFAPSEDGEVEININSCQGRCYYDEDESAPNHIVSKYNRKITYTDKIHSNVNCGVTEDQTFMNCSFKDCFYKNNNYNRYAIGINLLTEDEEPWIDNVNGNEYMCTAHYILYLTSYTNGKENITITPTETRICKEAFDAHEYDYNSSSSNPFVTIDY